MARKKIAYAGGRKTKKLPKEIRKKLLTKEGGKTVPQTNGFYLVFIRGKGRNSRYKAVAWEYLVESNWCTSKKQAIDKVARHPRRIIE